MSLLAGQLPRTQQSPYARLSLGSTAVQPTLSPSAMLCALVRQVTK